MIEVPRTRLRIRNLASGAIAALLVAVAIMMATSIRVKALPKYDVDELYYDSNDLLVAEHRILCDGTHSDWGDQTLAAPGHVTNLSYTCDVGDFTYCYFGITITGQLVLEWCD